jgi:predicted RNA-binding protein Jag
MNAHERKIVHDRLATEEGVSTESAGIGPDRRVVVKKIS